MKRENGVGERRRVKKANHLCAYTLAEYVNVMFLACDIRPVTVNIICMTPLSQVVVWMDGIIYRKLPLLLHHFHVRVRITISAKLSRKSEKGKWMEGSIEKGRTRKTGSGVGGT